MIRILHIIYVVLLALLSTAGLFVKKEFKNEELEETVFYTFNGMGDSDTSIIFYALSHYCIPFILTSIIYLLLTYYPIDIITNFRSLITIIITVISFVYFNHYYSITDYLSNNIKKSKVFEKEYKDLEDIKLTKKRNLIMIYVESLETTFFSKEHGGEWNEEIIPELYELLNDKDSIYFKEKNNQGARNIYGSAWTTSSVISSTTGIPFKIPLTNAIFNEKNYLKKVKALGDVLKENGYHNEVISGAKTKFGGLWDYFKIHGDYEIIDPDTLDKYGYEINDETKGSWGFNDKYALEIAKERILKHVKEGKNFNETIIGIDSHPMDGYKTPFTLNKFKHNYENVYATDSMLIGEFIDWLKKQDFYKDTTILILGDHYCMQTNFMGHIDMNKRGKYNVIINGIKKPINNSKRVFTNFDIYPTLLSALGITYKGKRIGLGVDLYTDEKTLCEKYGVKELEKELKKKSSYYEDLLREE